MNFHVEDSLGSFPTEQIAQYLSDIEDIGRADALVASAVQGQNFLRPRAPFMATGLQVGYIAPGERGSTAPIMSATQMEADRSLIGQQIKLSFDRAFVREYPGVGIHSVLCEFVGRNQIDQESEELRMALRFKSADGTLSSTAGAPIFLGLTVGPNGIAFEGRTVNVSSSNDDVLLEALDGEAFKSGLALMNHIQPGLKPFVSLVRSTVKGVASRSRNRQIHNFNLGLDFENTTSSVRLRHGSYVVVQTDATDWDWGQFSWSLESNALSMKNGQPIDFNYLVIGLSAYTQVAPIKPVGRSRRSA